MAETVVATPAGVALRSLAPVRQVGASLCWFLGLLYGGRRAAWRVIGGPAGRAYGCCTVASYTGEQIPMAGCDWSALLHVSTIRDA